VYTVWSKGRLLGRTTLDFCPSDLKARMGWFEPTEIGERLMPALTYLGPYHDRITAEWSEGSLPSGEALSPGRMRALAREALVYKMTDEANAALAALHLVLRDADGTTIPTDHISVQDTEYLRALVADEDHDELERDFDPGDEPESADEFSAAMIELGIEEDLIAGEDGDDARFDADGGGDWEESALPRYQIFVELVDGHSVPVSDRWKDDPYVQGLVAGVDPFADRRAED